MSGKSIAGVLADTLADGAWRAKARPEQLPPKPRPAIRSQPFQSPGDLALVLGDDSEAPAQIGQPAIIKGADLAGSNVEGGAPFDGEAFETRPLGGDHSTLPLFIDGSLLTGTQPLPTD